MFGRDASILDWIARPRVSEEFEMGLDDGISISVLLDVCDERDPTLTGKLHVGRRDDQVHKSVRDIGSED